MGSLFRSEEMTLCQLFLQSESAFDCVSELGELRVLQFQDMNKNVNAFQRKFVHEIRRCTEMERQLEFLESQIKTEGIEIADANGDICAPHHKEECEMEVTLEKLERNIREVNDSEVSLKRTYLELHELREILRKTQQFFDEDAPTSSAATRRFSQSSILSEAQKTFCRDPFSCAPKEHHTFCDLDFVTGVILRKRMMPFETMLWRVSRGNVFVRHDDIEQSLEDPVTGDKVNKSVFIIFFQGDHLKTKVTKICQGFRTNMYPCPEKSTHRAEMLEDVTTQIEDMNVVLRETTEHKHSVLSAAAKNLKCWSAKIRKTKAIFFTLNMFNLHVTQKTFIGEAWIAVSDLSKAQAALKRATNSSGSAVTSIINRIDCDETPPTYHRVNKFTSGFQAIVDAYGVAKYREVNPAPYTIITFPFLFAVMFGDAGHGLLMALFGAFLVIREKKLGAIKTDSDIFAMFFGGRYIILLMGLFSIYTGFLYNDCFAKAMNIFGSSWVATRDVHQMRAGHVELDPIKNYDGTPYPLGIDPVWQTASNKILFLNSYKMKLSVIVGVVHMLFGVFLSSINHCYFGKTINICCEFIPQVIFLVVIFGYMDAIIMYKWIFVTAEHSSCAPSVLITLINMFMQKYPEEPCSVAQMYTGQKELQIIFVLCAIICIPWMLVIKPWIIKRQRDARKGYRVTFHNSSRSNSEPRDGLDKPLEEAFVDIINETRHPTAEEEIYEKKEESMGDVIIHQAIHTIEYCLGSISHTASYLRLWALSLAHAQLSEVLWGMVMSNGLIGGVKGGFIMYVVFAIWATLTVTILLLMEGLSAFLHALRLHWVEFQSKFYAGSGEAFVPFSLCSLVNVSQD